VALGHGQLPWVELDGDGDELDERVVVEVVEPVAPVEPAASVVVEVVAALLLVELVVAVAEVEPTEARSSDAVPLDPEVDPEVGLVVGVAGAATARAAVPPTTLIAAADAATMRDRRVRLQRRRVAVLISGRFMVPPCAVSVG
jgi:hypothetical protein